MGSLLEGITKIIKICGDACSFIILLIMACVTYEVVARYVFNSPTSWAWLVNKQLFGVFVLVAGGYSLIHGNHIRIEMLYQHFSKRTKRVIHILSFLAALCFLGALLWKSSVMGLEAWGTKEKAIGVFKMPLYPLKLFMPIGTLLFLLGCIVRVIKNK